MHTPQSTFAETVLWTVCPGCFQSYCCWYVSILHFNYVPHYRPWMTWAISDPSYERLVSRSTKQKWWGRNFNFMHFSWFNLDARKDKDRWKLTFADHSNTSSGPVLNTHATATFHIYFVPKWYSLIPEFYCYKNSDNPRFDPCALENPNIWSNIHISAVYVPAYRLQAPQGRSSRSRT